MYPFADLVDALASFVAAHPDEAFFFWLDCLVIDEHATQVLPQEWWSTSFKESIRTIGRTGRNGALFQTVVRKAWLSSPRACIATVNERLKRLKARHDKGAVDADAYDHDVALLTDIRAACERVPPAQQGKLQALFRFLEGLGYRRRKAGKRVVIFSERIDTLKFLATQIAQRFDLGWTAARRLIEETGALELPAGFCAGASTDHLEDVSTTSRIVDGVVEQIDVIRSAGGVPVVLPMPRLCELGLDEEGFVRVYGDIARAAGDGRSARPLARRGRQRRRDRDRRRHRRTGDRGCHRRPG